MCVCVIQKTFATVQDRPEAGSEDILVPKIRQQLRLWAAENDLAAPRGAPADNGRAGEPRNLLTRSRHVDELGLGSEEGPDLDQPLSDGDGFLELLPPPSEFKAGDLVELQEYGDRMSLMAVCLGNIHGVYHFYTATGKWYPVPRLTTHFVVKNFAPNKALEPVIDKLPKEALPWETLKTMKDLKMGPDRKSGGELLRMMLKFQEKAEADLQRFATRFENAHGILAHKRERYLTLDRIAARLIHQGKGQRETTNPATLFAVHRVIMSDDVGFRRLGAFGPTGKSLFEVTAPEDVVLIRNMQTLVRLFTDIPGKMNTSLSDLKSSKLSQSQLGRFILNAREAVDQSRRYRDWTPHGTLSPAKEPMPPPNTTWTDVDLSILHFMHLWAGCDQFSPSSSFHWIGSMILRALGRYKDSEYLSTSTGWTFLQEVGYVSPWDIHVRHTQRVPGLPISREKGFERMKLGPEGVSAWLVPDPFVGKRKEWTNHRVFAIDSKDTVDVDDAVSIEKTDNPGEYWIHVHVADPASRIGPKSLLGERAQLLPLNLYLSGHESNIWGVGNEVQELFSLGPNKPCLTFSGRLNNDGKLLEYTVTPGKLTDFIFMTPEEVNEAVGFDRTRRPPAWSAVENFKVGEAARKKPENRKMTNASELREDDLDSLKELHRLAIAIGERRLAKGSMPMYPTRVNVKASFDETSINEVPPGLMTCNGDPSISISWGDGSEAPLVTSTMILAGEIAARWCADRNMPIPFNKQSLAQENRELLKAYTERFYYPLVLRGEQPSPEQFRQLRELTGPDETSTRPGSHFLMGVDAYAKVTSPLRRYSDLLAHWQIESALVQEMETGEVALDKLPFSETALSSEVIPWMLLRQRIIKRLGNVSGNTAYMHQALFRAWKYPSKNDSKLPDTFRLTVEIPGAGHDINTTGRLDWFGLDAWMVPAGLASLGVQVADVRRGDVFEVKLKDINVHMGQVFVEAVGKISPEECGGADAK